MEESSVIIIAWNTANTASRAVVHQLHSARLVHVRPPLVEKQESVCKTP